ncbi:hypothetical protein BH24ACT12_BH24ACT12_01760 [soil metagenome]
MVRVALLGPIEIRTDARAVSLGKRERVLVALLALHAGRVVPAGVLIDKLWGQDPPETAANALQVYVSRIRRTLGAEAIRTGGSGYSLSAGEGDVDVHVFERMAEEGRQALAQGRADDASRLLRSSLGMWRGAPFAECSDLPFAQSQAQRLEEKRLLVMEDALEADIARGAGALVVDEVAALCRQHPFRERMIESWMRALYQAGRQTEALAVYASHRTTLVEELGLEPAARLQHVQRAILDADERLTVVPAAPEMQVRRPPAPRTALVGRTDEVREVAALLLPPAGERLLTLHGPGGTGKTRLLIEVAHQVADSFPDGCCWVPLAAVAEPAQALSSIARSLGLTEAGDRPVAAVIGRQLARRELLLVMDNVEHLLPDVAVLISELLDFGPTVRIVATSRVALRVSGERRFPVGPLAVPPEALSHTSYEHVPACALFLDRARRVRPNLETTPETLAAVARICTQLEGLPLALELAAARCSMLSLPSLADRLEDRLSFLTSGSADSQPQHRSLRAALEWSYQLLDGKQQKVVARLSVVRGGSSVADAGRGVDHDGALGRQVLDVLQQLSDASMLHLVGGAESDAGRITVLETVRQFAAERLAEHPDDESLTRRALCRYCMSLLPDGAVRVPPTPAGLDEAARVIADQDNIRAAIGYAWNQEEPEVLAHLVLGMAGCAGIAFTPEEADGWLVDFTSHVRSPTQRMAAAAMRGYIAMMRGRPAQGAAVLEQALADPDADAVIAWPAVACALLGLQLSVTGNPAAKVEALVRKSVAAARGTGDCALLAYVLSIAGAAACETELVDALPLLEEAVQLGAECHQLSALLAASNLAEATLGAGDSARAQTWARTALDVPMGHVAPGLRSYPLDLLAACLLAESQVEAAMPYLREALAKADWADDLSLLNELLVRCATVAALRQDPARARALLAEYAAGLCGLTEVVSSSNRLLLERHLSGTTEGQLILDGHLQRAARLATRPARPELLAYALGGPLPSSSSVRLSDG